MTNNKEAKPFSKGQSTSTDPMTLSALSTSSAQSSSNAPTTLSTTWTASMDAIDVHDNNHATVLLATKGTDAPSTTESSVTTQSSAVEIKEEEETICGAVLDCQTLSNSSI